MRRKTGHNIPGNGYRYRNEFSFPGCCLCIFEGFVQFKSIQNPFLLDFQGFRSIVYLTPKEFILSEGFSDLIYVPQNTILTRSLHPLKLLSKLNDLLKNVSQLGQRKD